MIWGFFMEIIKKNINMNHVCGKAVLQLTLNDDINIPDSKSDIYKKIIENGEVVVENLRPGDEKAGVSGKLKFNILYQTDRGRLPLDSLEGEIEFNETVNIPGVFENDMIKCRAVLDDLTVSLINSRKVSVSAIVSLEVYGENTYKSQGITEIPEDYVEHIKKNVELLALIENKRDILRIREQHELSSNKPNMGNIIYSHSCLRNIESKSAEDELIVKGEMYIFAMYTAEDNQENIQYIEEMLPFMGKIPLSGANAGMIADVDIVPSQKTLSIKPDKDGEPRVLESEMLLELDIKLYEEQNMELVNDVYSLKKQLEPVFETAKYDKLLVHNNTRCRVGEKFKVNDNKEQILQIINNTATISLDDIGITNNGLRVEGAVKINIMYISSDDTERLGCITKEIPFSQDIDVTDMSQDAFYTIKPSIEQIGTIMLSGDELEVKMVIGLDALVLKPMEMEIITDINEKPLDYAMLKKLPGMYGCIVKQGDTLWNIAKKHNTTVEKIMTANNLSSSNLKPGMKLLIIKESVC